MGDLKLLGRTTKGYLIALTRAQINSSRADAYSRMKKTEIVERATAALDGKWLPDDMHRSALVQFSDFDAPPAASSENFRQALRYHKRD